MPTISGDGQRGRAMARNDTPRPRYLVEKRGSFFWQPSKGLKRLGYKSVPLGKDEAKAIDGANIINARLDQHRGAMPIVAKDQHGTIPWLIENYKNSPGYSKLAAGTKAVRQSELRRILAWSTKLGDPPMRAITKLHAEQLWSSIIAEADAKRSIAHRARPMVQQAETIIGRCSHLWNYALDLEDVVERNPFRKLRRELPDIPPRPQVWKPEQIAIVIEKAIELGYPSIALAVLVGINTAQRPSDILRLKWSNYDPTNGKNGAITLTQAKTGATVTIPVTEELKIALHDAKRELTESKVVALNAVDRPIMARQDGQHYTQRRIAGQAWKLSAFERRFRYVRGEAEIPADMQFRDMRRTAATTLAEAGCSLHEIAAIGGWTVENVAKMMATYAKVNLTMAQNAVAKLEQYRAKRQLEQ